jgi:RNA polymerase sigma-70 factor (ECF subfamily)
MRNHCFQELRNRPHNLPDEVLTQVVSDDDEELHQKIVEEYTLAQMQEAINELNTEQRATITLFYLQKQTYEQICASTGYNFMQVKSYIQNGKRNLKLILLKKLNQVQ